MTKRLTHLFLALVMLTASLLPAAGKAMCAETDAACDRLCCAAQSAPSGDTDNKKNLAPALPLCCQTVASLPAADDRAATLTHSGASPKLLLTSSGDAAFAFARRHIKTLLAPAPIFLPQTILPLYLLNAAFLI